jgi:hypothetical protein
MNDALSNLSLAQLKQAVQLREQIEELQRQLDALQGGVNSSPRTAARAGGMRRPYSAAARRRMAAAQRARRAAEKARSPKPARGRKGRRKMSAAARARLSAMAAARWAKAKAAGKTRL